MVQRREDFRFALKTREPVGVRRERSRQNLDGDLAFEPGVRRAVDLAHPAGADDGDHLVGTETSAGSKHHRGRDYRVELVSLS